MKLQKIAEEIRTILEQKRNDLGLYFIEDDHKYFMKNLKGELKSDWISVSKVVSKYHDEFPTEEAAFKKAKGDLKLKEQLIKEWADAGVYANNVGSRVHYNLEIKNLLLNNIKKEVRNPGFKCDLEQTIISDNMVLQGEKYIDLMLSRGAVLIDTEIVMGSPEYGYTGQADKIWLLEHNNKLYIIITDWKTNKPKNFLSTKYTKNMYEPYSDLPNTALGHYYTQLAFYTKLLKYMLKGSKYEDLEIVRGYLVLLTQDSFVEYLIPKDVINRTLNTNINFNI